MEIYLVGGAVRDGLLGKPIKERDWVVVGATEADMLALGYKKVGRDFPVFLHPETHEEYALARTERKTGKGYTQFAFHTDPSVTLNEDLQRRDLTINAMAQTSSGELIDPYGGSTDLKNKILRHVSPAFAEDPVRVLRVARFAAKFGDFKVHPTTLQLMRDILIAGELDALVPERVWQELQRALSEPNPEMFFEVLNDCGALEQLFPEIAAELDKILKSLKQTTLVSRDPVMRFAGAIGVLPREKVVALCKRYHAPRAYLDFAKLVSGYKEIYCHIMQTGPKTVLSLFDQVDAYRRPNRLEQLFIVCEIVTRCCKNEDIPKDVCITPRIEFLQKNYKAAKNVAIKPLVEQGLKGEELREKIQELRLEAISSSA